MGKRRQFSSRWFRVYDEAVDDPKIQMLPDRLHRFWFNCMCLACKHGGYLPPIPEIAWRIRKTESAVSEMIQDLISRNLLDQEPDGHTPHNWTERQFDSDVSTGRVRKFRERQRNGDETFPKRDETVTETHQNRDRSETETETETEHTQSVSRVRSMPAASDLSGITSLRFDEFWQRYPRKQRMDFTAMQWNSVVTLDNETAVFTCLDRYLASDEVSRGVVQNPDKWLYEQHRNGWTGDWPKARDSPAAALPRKTKMEEAVARFDRV